MVAGADERVWGGQTLAARRSARRAALLDAALDLVGELGGPGVTVRSVCKRAQLTDRYFYESFSGRDELLSALFLQVADEIQVALKASVAGAGEEPERQARAILGAFASICLDDPRKGRLILVEPMADPALTGVTVASVPSFTRLVRAQLPRGASRETASMAAVGLLGAVAALFSSWMTGSLTVSREELLDHCTETILLYWQRHQQR